MNRLLTYSSLLVAFFTFVAVIVLAFYSYDVISPKEAITLQECLGEGEVTDEYIKQCEKATR